MGGRLFPIHKQRYDGLISWNLVLIVSELHIEMIDFMSSESTQLFCWRRDCDNISS